MNKKFLAATWTAIVLCGLLDGATGAYAQGNTWIGMHLAETVEAARWKWDILRVNAAFRLGNAGYDTDIYYGYFGQHVADWTFTAGLPVQVLVPVSKKVVLDFSNTAEYLFYHETENERSLNNTFHGQFHLALDRVYFQIGRGLSNVRRRYSPELDLNVREKRDTLNGLALWQVSEAASFAIVYNDADFDYGDAEYLGARIADRLNRKEQYFDLIAYIQPNSRARFFVDGQFGTYSFTGESPEFQEAHSFSVFGGIDFVPRIGEPSAGLGLRGGFRLGYARLNILDPLFADGSGLAGEADLDADLTRKISLQIHFSRGFRFSILSGATYYLSTVYGTGIRHRLSRRATLSYSFLFGRTTYAADAAAQDLGYRFMNHVFGLDISLARYLSLSPIAAFGRRLRYSDGVSFSRDFFGLTLTYGSLRSRMTSAIGGPIRRMDSSTEDRYNP